MKPQTLFLISAMLFLCAALCAIWAIYPRSTTRYVSIPTRIPRSVLLVDVEKAFREATPPVTLDVDLTGWNISAPSIFEMCKGATRIYIPDGWTITDGGMEK